MDAAIRIFRNNKYLLSFIALALALTASASAQAPAFSLSTSTVTFNQSNTGQTVTVNSTGDPIPYTISAPIYSGGGNGAWLRAQQVGTTTPSTIDLSLASTAGLAVGTYTATVTLTATPPSTALQTAITVTLNFGSGGGTGGGSTTITLNKTQVSLSAQVGSLAFDNTVTVSTASTTSVTIAVAPDSAATWLSVTPSTPFISSGFAATLNLTANAGLLGAGSYTSTVTVTPSTGTAATFTVNFVVGGTGGGGSGTITVSPSNVRNWTYPGGGFPSEVLTLSSPTGAFSYSATATSTNNWLLINGSTAVNGVALTSGIALSSSASIASLTTGFYVGIIQINDSNGETALVTVNLTINGGTVTGLTVTPASLAFSSVSGSTPPAQSISATSTTGGAFTATSSASWLTAAVSTGSLFSNVLGTIQVSANPGGLPNGTYPGTIIVTVGAQSQAVAVTLTVGSSTGGGGTGGLTVTPAGSNNKTWTYNTNGAFPITENLGLISATNAATYNATVTTTGGNWLLINGGTSATAVALNQGITISPSSTITSLATGSYTGNIAITDSNGETAAIVVTLSVNGGGAAPSVTVTPASLTFTGTTGSGALTAQKISIASASTTAVTFTVTAATTTGGTWLSTDTTSATTPKDVNVTATATGLAAGTYNGTVTITPTGGTAVNVPVTLTLTAPTISATPTTLTFAFSAGGANPAAQTVTVSGTAGTGFSATASSTGNWLKVTPVSGTTPGTVSVSIDGTGLAAGTYNGTVTIAATGTATGSTTVAVTLTVTAPTPTVSRITNGASFATGSISPGEVITLFGTDLGPGTPATLTVDAGKVTTTLGGVQVLINGIAAPMLYVSSTQLSAVVPYEIAQFANANVQVKFVGQTSAGTAVGVTTTAPGVFTLNSSGTGPGAILNQNLSVNAPNNAATRGDTVVIYATGEGQTAPLGVTGKVTTVNATPPLTPAPLLPVSVLIDGKPAAISFVGQAPGLVSGVLQLNVVVPTTAATGAVSLTVSVGGNASQSGVTISLK